MDSPKNTQYIITHTETDHTGIRLFSAEDPNTGVVITFAEFNKDFDVHVSVAWTGARTSRSDDDYRDIFAEVRDLVSENSEAAAKKIEKFGLNYGHSSILGMAPIFIFLNNIPIEVAFWLFNHMSTGDGQELSSRYVNFDDLKITHINEFIDFSELSDEDAEQIKAEWFALQELAVNNYEKWKIKVRDAYTAKFMNDDQEVTIPESTMTARVLDIARMWIPVGAGTSMCVLGNLRLFNDFIKKLYETGEHELIALADQLKQVLRLKETEEGADLQANLAGLVKYTDPQYTVQQNLEKLREYVHKFKIFDDFVKYKKLSSQQSYVNETVVSKVESVSIGELLVMQYMLVIHPNLDELELLSFLRILNPKIQKEMGEIVLNGHNQHNLMSNMGDIRGNLYVIETAMAYLRDLNRHRAEGRLVPMFETQDIESLVDDGFNKNYQIMNTDGLTHLLEEWVNDGTEYYKRLKSLANLIKEKVPNVDLRFMRKLFTLGHQTKVHLSGPLVQWNYMINQRSTGGNDLGNRNIVYKILTDLRLDPFLAGMAPHITAPNLDSLEEFKSRK